MATWKIVENLPSQESSSTGAPTSGAYLKAYTAGSTPGAGTIVTMATRVAGTPTTTAFITNAMGRYTVSNVVERIFIDREVKFVLYPDQTDADAHDTSNAIFVMDNVKGITDISDSSDVPHTPAGTSAVATDVQTYLRKYQHISAMVTDLTGATDMTDEYSDALQWIVDNGGGKLDHGGGENHMLLRNDSGALTTTPTEQLRALKDYSSINGIDLASSGCKITLGRDYASSERDIIHRFKNCTNIHVGTFELLYSGTRSNQANEGGVFCYYRNGNKNISHDDIYIDDWSLGIWDNPASMEEDFTNFWSGKKFKIHAKDTGYPISSDNGGNGLDVEVYADSCTRACTLQDSKNAKAKVYSKNHKASNDVGTSGTQINVYVEYINTESVKSSQDDGLSLQYPSEFNTDIGPWTGTHTGSNGAAVLLDGSASFTTDKLIGYRVYNLDDKSSGLITDNDGNSVTGGLSSGALNTWSNGDRYVITDITGTATATGATLTMDAGWPTNALKGYTAWNTTDGSFGIIASNTATVATLDSDGWHGGTNNSVTSGDSIKIGMSHICLSSSYISTVSTFDGNYIGYGLRSGVGVGAVSADRDPNYKIVNTLFKLTLRTDDSTNQQSFDLEHADSFDFDWNYDNCKFELSIDGALLPRMDMRSVKSAVIDCPYSTTQLNITLDEQTYSGTDNNGSNNQSILTDTTKSWGVNDLVGQILINTTTKSWGWIVSNDATTVTPDVLRDGDNLENDFDDGDGYSIRKVNPGHVTIKGGEFQATNNNTWESGNITMIGCKLTNSTLQSIINKKLIGCNWNGYTYNTFGNVGQFTMSAAASKTVTDTRVTTESVIMLIPADATAGALQAGVDHLYVIDGSKVANTSFTVNTSNSGNAAGTEVFRYVIFG